MKRILALALIGALLLAFTGCGMLEEKETFDVEGCLEEAEDLIAEGKLEEAEKLLKRGIRKAEDPDKLEACLLMVQAMLDAQDSQTTVPTEPATEAPQQPTEPPTEAPTEATRPASGNLLDGFTRDEIYQINVFLSNFSEQGFVEYPCIDRDLVTFGYIYAKINNREVLGLSDGYYYVEKANMDSILTRFFGSTVSVSNSAILTGPYGPSVEYRNGAYYFPAADGASYASCSVATSMTANGDGTYTVVFDMYDHENPHETMSAYYSMTPKQIANRGELNYIGSGIAVVRDYTRSNGVESYQIITYRAK